MRQCLKAGRTGSYSGSEIATDAVGNIYVTGNFYNTATFRSNSLVSIGNAELSLDSRK